MIKNMETRRKVVFLDSISIMMSKCYNALHSLNFLMNGYSTLLKLVGLRPDYY